MNITHGMAVRLLAIPAKFAATLALILGSIFASAATITVTSLDASSTATNGQVSLAEAIQAANGDISVDGSAAGSGSDTIVFHSSLAGQTIRWSASAALSITSNITIDGDINGDGVPDIILSGDVNNNGTRDVNESSGLQTNAGGNLTIQKLDFRHFSGNLAGGAVRANGGNITIEDSVFRENAGAAINASPTTASIVVRNTKVINNNGSVVGGTAMSSIVRLLSAGNHVLENVLIADNTGTFGATGAVAGAAIIVASNSGGSVSITNSTVVNNVFTSTGTGTITSAGIGWVSGGAGTVTIQNSIFTGNTHDGAASNANTNDGAGDGYTSVTNLIGSSVNFANVGGGDYRLASTAANAINQGTLAGSPSTDIRGFNRPRGGGVDIGAYEVLYSAAPVVDLDTGTGGNNSSVNFSGSAWL